MISCRNLVAYAVNTVNAVITHDLKLMTSLLLPLLLLACILLSPQPQPPPPNATYSDLDMLGSANVPSGDPRFWAHLVCVYVVAAVALMVRLFDPSNCKDCWLV